MVHMGWVDLEFGCFMLLSQFGQISICPSRIGKTVEHPKLKSTQPRCTSRWDTI